MTEPVAVFTDQFQLNTSPYGATLNFLLSDPCRLPRARPLKWNARQPSE